MSKLTFKYYLRILISLGPIFSARYQSLAILSLKNRAMVLVLVLRESIRRMLMEVLLEICILVLQMIMQNPVW